MIPTNKNLCCPITNLLTLFPKSEEYVNLYLIMGSIIFLEEKLLQAYILRFLLRLLQSYADRNK